MVTIANLKQIREEEVFSIINSGWVDFRMLDLRGISFSDMTLNKVDFRGSDLSDASFKGATLKNCIFSDCRMMNVNFENSHIFKTDFLASEIVEAKFQKSSIVNSKFLTQLYYTDFSGAKLKSVNFFDANMVEVIFSNCMLKDVGFEWIERFIDVDFSNTDLSKNVSFIGTVLNRAEGTKAFTTYFGGFPVSYIPEVGKVFYTPARKIFSLKEFSVFIELREDDDKKELKAMHSYFKKMKKLVKNN